MSNNEGIHFNLAISPATGSLNLDERMKGYVKSQFFGGHGFEVYISSVASVYFVSKSTACVLRLCHSCVFYFFVRLQPAAGTHRDIKIRHI